MEFLIYLILSQANGRNANTCKRIGVGGYPITVRRFVYCLT